MFCLPVSTVWLQIDTNPLLPPLSPFVYLGNISIICVFLFVLVFVYLFVFFSYLYLCLDLYLYLYWLQINTIPLLPPLSPFVCTFTGTTIHLVCALLTAGYKTGFAVALKNYKYSTLDWLLNKDLSSADWNPFLAFWIGSQLIAFVTNWWFDMFH